MLRLVSISLMVAAVMALPTLPNLQQPSNQRESVIEMSKITEFKPGEEPKQSTDIRLIKDGQSIPIQQEKLNVQNPQWDRDQQSKVQQSLDSDDSQLKSGQPLLEKDEMRQTRQAIDIDLSKSQENPLTDQLQSQKQDENQEPMGRQQRMQDIQRADEQLPETTTNEQTVPSSDIEEEEQLEEVARISVIRTVIVIMSPQMAPADDEKSLASDLQPEKPELDENQELNLSERPPEQIEEKGEMLRRKRRQLPQREQQLSIPTSQREPLFDQRSENQQDQQQPVLRIRKRRQIQAQRPSQMREQPDIERESNVDQAPLIRQRPQLNRQNLPFQPLSSNVEVPLNRQSQLLPNQWQMNRQQPMQSEFEPPLVMQKRDLQPIPRQRQLERDQFQQGQQQPMQSQMDGVSQKSDVQSQLPRQRRNIQPQVNPQTQQLPIRKVLDQQQVQQPTTVQKETPRRTRDVFQPASTIPKVPLDQQKLLQEKVDVQDRLEDQLPSSRLNRGVLQHQTSSQDPNPLTRGSNLEENIVPQQQSEQTDRLKPYVEQLDSLIDFMEKTKEHIQEEAHHLPEHQKMTRKRRDEPFPSVLIPPRLVQKENVEEQQPDEEMRGKEEEPQKPEEPEAKEAELPEVSKPDLEKPESQKPELEAPEDRLIQQKKGKELEEPLKEEDFKKVLESMPTETMEKAKMKGEGFQPDIQQPSEVEENTEEGEEKLTDTDEQRKQKDEHPVSGMMEKGKEGISDTISEAQKPVEEGEENIKENLPSDIESVKESLPDIEKSDRESHAKNLDTEQLEPDVGQESEMPESVTPAVENVPKSESVAPESVTPSLENIESDKESVSPDLGQESISPDLGKEEESVSPDAGQDIPQQKADSNLENVQDARTGKQKFVGQENVQQGQDIPQQKADSNLEDVQDARTGKEMSQPNIQSHSEGREETIDLPERLENQPESDVSPMENPPNQKAGDPNTRGNLEAEKGQENLQQAEPLPDPVEVHSKHQQERLGKEMMPEITSDKQSQQDTISE